MQKPPDLQWIPPSRLFTTLPAQVWALGWIALVKGCLWLFITDIHHPALLVKYTLMTIPLIAVGVGVWNLRNWAFWGIGILCALDLAAHLVLPGSIVLVDPGPTGNRKVLYSTVLNLISGPGGDLAGLCLLPFARGVRGKWELLKPSKP